MALASRGIVLSRQQTTKALIRLGGCAGRFAPLLLAYGKNRFFSCRAQIKQTEKPFHDDFLTVIEKALLLESILNEKNSKCLTYKDVCNEFKDVCNEFI